MANVSWWVVQSRVPSHSAGTVPVQQAVQAAKKPTGAVAGPFTTQKAAMAWINKSSTSFNIPNPLNAVGNTVKGWLSGLGGQMASGIDQAFVSGLTDLFDVIIGPLEIVIGFLFIMWAFLLFFKDDIMNALYLVGAGVAIGAK